MLMERADYTRVLGICKLHGEANPQLWVDVLTLFADRELTMQTAETAVLLEEVLASVERLKLMSPLGMVQVLSNNRSATVGMVKDMIIQSMHAEKAALILDRKLVSSYEEETLQLGKSLAALEG